jgi:thiamine biosynthesis lipoprotein
MNTTISHPPGEGEMGITASSDFAHVHRFSHLAMASEFHVWIRHEDSVYAGQAAWEAFRLLDRLEAELSRFEPNSDISRLNLLPPGEIFRPGEDVFACLQLASTIQRATGGAFDVTAGILKDLWQPPVHGISRIGRWIKSGLIPVGGHHLHFSDREMILWKDAPVQIDLGAIGKGYAIDRMVASLQEWDLNDFLVHGGASSVAARGCAPGHDGWPVALRDPRDRDRVLAHFEFSGQALGASGLEKGPHIIDPVKARPAKKMLAVWVIAAEAATADAFSTAFMVMPFEAIKQCLAERGELGALLLPAMKKSGPIYLAWPGQG